MALVGLAELADLFGVTKQVLTNWRSRKAGFPAPIADLKSGPVWDHGSVVSWAQANGIDLLDENENSLVVEPSGRMAKVAALMNMKGGVGKSTLTANLGWYCAMKANLRVLLIDLDPQFNLSQYILGIKDYEDFIEQEGLGIDHLFKSSAPGSDPVDIVELIREIKNWQDGSCIHLVPAKLDLSWSIRNAQGAANLLEDHLADIKGEYDLILIDCAPTDSVLSDAAFMAADYVFVPVKPEFLSAIGVPLLLESMRRFQERHPSRAMPMFGGIIFNDTGEKPEHDRARKYVRNIAEGNDLHVFRHEISHSDSYPVGSRVGKPIFLTDNARNTKKEELLSVAREFLYRLSA